MGNLPPELEYDDFTLLHPDKLRDIPSQIKACLKVVSDGGEIVVAHHHGSHPYTTVTYVDKSGMVCGYGIIDGNLFEPSQKGRGETNAKAPEMITGFEFFHDGVKIFSAKGLDPIAPADFYAMFFDPANYANVYEDFVSLTDGGANWTGGNADDWFHCGTGPNTVTGGQGDDLLYKIDRGSVSYEGGQGADGILFYKADGFAEPAVQIQKLVINLNSGEGTNPYGGTLTLSGVENVVGTIEADRITGNNRANVLDGNGAASGKDVIDARGGDDRVVIDVLADATANGGKGFDTLNIFESADLRDPAFAAAYMNFESVFMISFGGDEFSLSGDNRDNVLSAYTGVDIIEGRGGNDTISGGNAFNADFSDGADVAVFSGKRSDYRIVFVDSVLTIIDKRSGSPDGTDSLTGIETLRFSNIDVNVASLFARTFGADELMA